MIPQLVKIRGAPFRVLPPGIYWATFPEIEARFALTPHRQALFAGANRVATALRNAGCLRMYLDGSFVTDKPHPADFDGCWDATGVVVDRLDRTLLNFADRRKAQKEKYLGEMFIAGATNDGMGTFLEFFQKEKHSGERKGILGIDLSSGGGSTNDHQ